MPYHGKSLVLFLYAIPWKMFGITFICLTMENHWYYNYMPYQGKSLVAIIFICLTMENHWYYFYMPYHGKSLVLYLYAIPENHWYYIYMPCQKIIGIIFICHARKSLIL